MLQTSKVEAKPKPKKYTNKEAMDLYQKGEWTQDQWKDWYIGTYGQSEWDKFIPKK